MTFTPEDIVFLILYTLVFVFGTAGNALVVKWFGMKEQWKKAGNTLVVVLAVNDFLSSIIFPLLEIHYFVLHALQPPLRWYLGSFVCERFFGLKKTFLVASSWLLVAITVARFRWVFCLA